MRTVPSFIVKRLRGSQGQPSEHLDADLLTAFAEQNVSRRERESVLKHLAECSSCREVYALRSTPSVNPVLDFAPANSHPIRWGWRMAAAAATVCVVIAGLWQFGWPGHPPASHPATMKVAAKTEQMVVARSTPSPVLAEGGRRTSKFNPLVRSKRPATPLIIETAHPHPMELVAGTGSDATANGTDEAKRSIVIPNQRIGRGPNPAALSESVARAQLQKQVVPPNAMFAARSAVAPVNSLFQLSVANRPSMWSLGTLSSDGTIQKSEDFGRTWQTITVDPVTPLYSISAIGSAVWVGGSSGKLFHSVDDGVSWHPVQLTEEGIPIHEGIVKLEVNGESLRVKTAAGLTFVTEDGGAHWQRE